MRLPARFHLCTMSSARPLGIIIIPLAAQKIGYIEATAIPGVAAMDVCMPIVERSCNQETIVYAFCIGASMCIAVPLLVPLVIG